MDSINRVTVGANEYEIKGIDSEARNVTEPIAQSGIMDAPPEISHRNFFRGKHLGNEFTDAQKAAIADGSFDDLYVGDFWEIDGYIWRIVDINYYIMTSVDTGNLLYQTTNHLVMMPEVALINSCAYSTTNNANGYRSSTVRGKTVTDAYSIVKQAFGEQNILTKTSRLITSIGGSGSNVTDAYANVDSLIELPTVEHFYGHFPLIMPGYTTVLFRENALNDNIQFAAFRLNSTIIQNNNIAIWCRNIRSYTHSTYIGANKQYGEAGCTETWCGIRPVFCLKG